MWKTQIRKIVIMAIVSFFNAKRENVICHIFHVNQNVPNERFIQKIQNSPNSRRLDMAVCQVRCIQAMVGRLGDSLDESEKRGDTGVVLNIMYSEHIHSQFYILVIL